MFGEGILNAVQLLEPALRFLGLALDEDQGPGKLVGYFVASAFELLLTARQVLEALFLLLDLVLFLPKGQQFGLCSLDLVLKFLSGSGLLKIEQFVVVFLKV